MALKSQSRPEPMNATPHHSKVKVSVTLSDSFYIAGDAVTGKMELESRADKGLGLGIIMVELVAVEELTSRDHSATSTFLHTRRLFQGPGLPPSNAVLPHPVAGEHPLPVHHHRARRGLTTFLFRLPLPASSPPSIDFGNGLARIRYEVRASVGVLWKDQNRLVTDKCSVDVLQRCPSDGATWEEGDGSVFDTWPTPGGLIVGEGGKIWVQARVLGDMLVAGASACVELQVKNHSAKRTTGLHLTLSRHLHLPSPANNAGRKLPPPLQISDTLASVTFRGPEYIAHPGTEGIANLVFDVPRAARTVSAYPRHGGDRDDELDVFKRKTAPLFEVRGVLAVRIAMPVGSKDIVVELPVAVFHPASLPPPPPEPYSYPTPGLYSGPYPNYSSSASPPPAPSPAPILYADPAQTPLYTHPTHPHAPPLPPQSIQAPINAQLVIPPYRPYHGQLWFPSPPTPTYAHGPYDQQPPPRPASADVGVAQVSAGLLVPESDHIHSHFPYQQLQHYPLSPEEATGHGARAARISHHLRATSRARSVSPPAQIPPPTQVAVEVISPKPMPSPKIITETLSTAEDNDPFAQSFGRVGTRTRSLSVVKLEEMAARAAAEAEAEATARDEKEVAVDKTLPVPPVPSGKPSRYGVNRRLAVQELFHHEQERGGEAETEEVFPRTPALSALSLLRPPVRHGNLASSPLEDHVNEESGLDALERRLAEQVGTRKPPTLPPPHVRTVLDPVSSPFPPLPPVPAPVPVPVKSMAQEQTDGIGSGAAVNESAISSLALAAEDFGGRNAKVSPVLLSVQGEAEDEAEGEDPDADGRTQHRAGGSSGSERGTYKPRSRMSGKSNSKERDKDRGKERKAKKKTKREGQDDEAVRLKRAAKGRVAEWLGKLEVYGPGLEQESDVKMELGSSSPPEPSTVSPLAAAVVTAAPAPPVISPVIIESEPNPRSSGFVPVSTLRRAPISLSPASSSAPAPAALPHAPPSISPSITTPVPVRQVTHRYAQPSQVEMKYNVKSARGGRGGRVTAVAAIWAEAARTTDSNTGSGAATPVPRQAKAARLAEGTAAPTKTKAAAASNKRLSAPASIRPMTSIVDPLRTPQLPVRTPRRRQSPLAMKEKEKELPRPPRALFGLGAAATATPSSPALSSSIATPMLSSTASLARPVPAPTAQPARGRDTPSPSSPPRPAQSRPQSQPPQPEPQSPPQPPPAAGQRPPMMNGGGFKAEFAFGQARLRDLIKRYQGQAA